MDSLTKFSVCLHVCGHNRMLVVRNRFFETAETLSDAMVWHF